MSKNKRRLDPQIRGFGSQPLLVNVSKAEAMMQRGRWDEAQEILESLDEQYPERAEVVSALVTLYQGIRDLPQYQLACTRLSRLKPDDPDTILMSAAAHLANFHPILALQTFEQYLERWPNHHRADKARATVIELEETKNQIVEEIGLGEEDSLKVAALHETAQSCVQQGLFSEARQAAEGLLSIRPDSIPDLNNLSLIYFFESDLEQAIATVKHVLDLDPDNIHALSNLTRYRCLNGQIEAAKQLAERLKTVVSDQKDTWVKKAEALSFLGDDQGVLDAFTAAQQAGVIDSPEMNPLLYHLAAVATMHMGQDKQARQYWQQALELEPGFELAQQNLDDSQQLKGQRHAPWAFNLSYWITPQAFRDLVLLYDPDRADDESFARESTRRYLQQHPEFAALVPLLLARGDGQARQFALSLAIMANTPEMQLALRDYALSQHGPDEMRQQAAQMVSQSGLFPPGLVRMWLEGKWREVMLLGIEIHDQQTHPHQPQVERLAREAVFAFKEGNDKP